MNYVIAARIPTNKLVSNMILVGPSEYIVRAVGNYADLFPPEIDASYIYTSGMDNLIAVEVDGQKYTAVYNQIDCANNQRTFYWNQATKELRIRFPNTINLWQIENIVIGVSLNLYKTNLEHTEWNGLSNGVVYRGDLKSCPSFNDAMDDIFTGQMKAITSSIAIENNEGRYSRINEDDNYNGRLILIETWFSETDTNVNLTQEFAGTITNIKTGKDLVIEFKDARDRLVEKTPFRTLDLEQWTYCSENLLIPEPWGACKNVPLKCINPNDTSGSNWQFMLADVTFLNILSIANAYHKDPKLAHYMLARALAM